MAIVLGTITYKDGSGNPVTVQCYVNNGVSPNVTFPGGLLFDHLGNTLSVDIGSGVGALKATLMTAPQVIGYDAHDAVMDASNRPIHIGGYASDAAPSAVSADADAVRTWFDRQGRVQTYTTERAGSGTPTYGQVTVDTTATGTQIKAANAKRRSITLVNHGTVDTFIGFDTSVSTSAGILLVGVKGAALRLFTTAQIRGINASSAVIGYAEEVLA